MNSTNLSKICRMAVASAMFSTVGSVFAELPQPTYDFSFNGDAKSVGGIKESEFLNANYTDGSGNRISYAVNAVGEQIGMYLWTVPQAPTNFTFSNDRGFSAVVSAMTPDSAKKVIVTFGSMYDGGPMVLLATGSSASEITLVAVKKSEVTVLASATVPDAAVAVHCYGVVVDQSKGVCQFYVDGAMVETEQPREKLGGFWTTMQVGGGHWGNPSGYGTVGGGNPSYLDAFVFYDATILTAEQMKEAAERFPVVRVPTYCYKFNGDRVSTGSRTDALDGQDSTATYVNDEDGNLIGVRLKHNVQRGGIGPTGGPMTVLAYVHAAGIKNSCLFSIGRKAQSLIMATGEDADTLVLAMTSDSIYEQIASIKVDNLLSAKHLVGLTLGADSRTLIVYFDGKQVAEVERETTISLHTAIQMGGLYGGFPRECPIGKASGESYMDEFVIYNGVVFSSADMREAAEKYPKVVDMPKPYHRWTFDGTCTTSDCVYESTFKGFDHGPAKYNEDNTGLLIYSGCQTPSSVQFGGDPKKISVFVRGTLPTTAKTLICGLGDRTQKGVFLATGTEDNTIELVTVETPSGGTSTQTIIATATVEKGTIELHNYVFTVDVGAKSYALYVDGVKVASVSPEVAPSNIWGYMQIGGMHGGAPSGYKGITNDGSYLDELRVYGSVAFALDQVKAIEDEYYVAPPPRKPGFSLIVR